MVESEREAQEGLKKKVATLKATLESMQSIHQAKLVKKWE